MVGVIWSGFDTAPPTKPMACVVCLGAMGGDFVRLACGHGGQGREPIHVECLVRSFTAINPKDPQPPRCPVCRAQVDSDTLSQLAGYVRRCQGIEFPNDEGVREEVQISDEEKKQLLNLVVDAEEHCTGHEIEPQRDEDRKEYYDDLMSHAETLAENLRRGVEERTLTREGIDQGLHELDEMEQRLSVCVGRVALLDHLNWCIRGVSFSELHDQLLRVRQEIEDVRRSVREQRERAEHEEESIGL